MSASSHLRGVAQHIADEIAQTEVRSLTQQIRLTRQRPRQIDGRLLALSRVALDRDLNTSEKTEVRAAFLECLEERLGGANCQSNDSS